jgi:lysophospholipase L1-like esterase
MESIRRRASHRRANHRVDREGWFVVAFVIVLAVAALPGAAAARVLLIGDSITEGSVSGTPGFPYAAVVDLQLGPDFEVTNLGCGGATSFDWRPDTGVTICGGLWINLWAERVLPNVPAEIATVMLGTNDATGFFEPAPLTGDAYAANIEAIVDGLHAAGVDQVMLMTPPARCTSAPQAVRDRLADYRLRIFTMCLTKPGVVCGPDVYKLLDPVADFASCNVHPNAQGHAKLGNALADAVEDLHYCTAISTPGFDACAPTVSLFANGAPATSPKIVGPNAIVQFQTVASDPQGIGFPAFSWLGSDGKVNVLWNFDGATAAPLAVFSLTPTVTFPLGAGGATETYNLAATVYDGSAEHTTVTVDVIATQPPNVSVLANGVPITGMLTVASGTQITFTAIASDADGLGYPVFAGYGNNTPITYIWNFGGGTTPGPLYVFSPQPPVTFTKGPGEASHTFNVSVTVWDAVGSTTIFPITVKAI